MPDTQEDVDFGDRQRRHMSFRDFAMLGTLIVNFAALIWGAATITSTVSQLSVTVQALDKSVSRVIEDMYTIKVDYNARIRVLEDRENRK